MVRRFSKWMVLSAVSICMAQEPESVVKPYNGSANATFAIGRCQHGVTNVSGAGGAEGFV